MSSSGSVLRLLALSAILVLFPAFSVLAEWVPNGTPVCQAVQDQTGNAIASDAAGGAIFVWQDRRAFPADSSDVYAQRFNDSGDTLWAPDGEVVCAWNGRQVSPRAIPDGVGGAIVAWEDYRTGNREVYAQKVDATGASLWTPGGVLLSAAGSDPSDTRLASDEAGGAIVTWVDDTDSDVDNEIWALRVDAWGNILWQVSVCDSTNNLHGRVTPDGAGGAIVAWVLDIGWIHAQRLDSAGSPQWGEYGVRTCPPLWKHANWPVVVSDDAGGAIIAWEDARQAPVDVADIYAQRISDTGTILWDSTGVAVCTYTQEQRLPNIVPDGLGGAIIAWVDERAGDQDIFAQRLDSSGAEGWTVGGEPVCDSPGDQCEWSPQMVSDDGGGVIVAWLDYSGLGPHIMAQRLSSDGQPLWGAQGDSVCLAYNEGNLEITTDMANGAILTWSDERWANEDVYAWRSPAGGGASGVPERVPEVMARAGQVHPNPFSSRAAIRFELSGAASVNLSVFDVAGRRVTTLVDGTLPPGDHRASWDGRDAQGQPSVGGVYFFRLRAGDRTLAREVTRVR